MKIGNRKLVGILLFFILFLITACKNETEPPISDYNYDYFPLKVGKYWVYEVDSVYITAGVSGTQRDSVKLWAKEETISQFIDNTNDTIYKIERYERRQATDPWVIKKVFSLQRNRTQAIRTEDNLRFVKLTFPLTEESRWTSTVFIPENLVIQIANKSIEVFKSWRSNVETLDEPFLNFPKTAVVTQAKLTNSAIEYRVVKEVYAKGVGLVQSEWDIYNAQCTNVICQKLPWEERAENGFKLRQKLIEYN